MNTEKTVSIIMGTYNGAIYIREQLDSILAQTYPLKEIIIQDDGSTDDTIAICQAYQEKYPIVHFSRNEHNLGFNANFKSAAMKATGDFVAFSDQDDVWFPTKIEKQVAAIGNHDICFSTHLRGADMEHTHLVNPQYSLEALLFCGFAGHTMLLRREFIQTDEYWLPKMMYDWSLAICAQLHGGIVMVDEPLNWHRTNLASACHEEMRKAGKKMLYTYIYRNTREPRFALAHQMARYMLHRNLLALFCLCYLCLKHGDKIYYSKNQKGLMGKVRSFCYPLIFAYRNTQYSRES